MRIELCSYSGYKLYPGHGKKCVKTDGKVVHFYSKKCRLGMMKLKRNPRKVRWTILYRRKQKKGEIEHYRKTKTVKIEKVQRAVGGLTLADLLAKRNQTAEVRQAQREQAIRAAKEKAKAKSASKKKDAKKMVKKLDKKTVVGKKPGKGHAAKPRVGGKR